MSFLFSIEPTFHSLSSLGQPGTGSTLLSPAPPSFMATFAFPESVLSP